MPQRNAQAWFRETGALRRKLMNPQAPVESPVKVITLQGRIG
jgi:hypothetical protein